MRSNNLAFWTVYFALMVAGASITNRKEKKLSGEQMQQLPRNTSRVIQTTNTFAGKKGRTQDSDFDAPLTKSGLIKDRLEWFILRLKSFVHGNRFDLEGFEWSKGQLHKHFEDIVKGCEPLTPRGKRILQQKEYASRLFHFVENSAVLLEFYALGSDRAQRIVHRMIRLNLKLMNLFDSRGNPDPSVDDFAINVYHSYDQLTEWKSVFHSIEKVPDSVKLAFKVQLVQAKKTLRALAKHVSGFDRNGKCGPFKACAS
ncbi:hypothetical protein OXX80_000193 [Metschnikowia pulcherrima]